MKRILLLMVAAMAIVMVPSFAAAEPKDCGSCRHGAGMQSEGMGPRHHAFLDRLEALALDQAQRNAVREIQNRTRKERVKKRAEIQVAMLELDELLEADAVDLKAAETKMRQVESLRTAMHLAMVREQEEIKARLTPEQRSQLHGKGAGGPSRDCRMHEGGMQHRHEGAGPLHR